MCAFYMLGGLRFSKDIELKIKGIKKRIQIEFFANTFFNSGKK